MLIFWRGSNATLLNKQPCLFNRIISKKRKTTPSPLRPGGVALLGIAQRRIRIKYAQKSRKDPRVKPLTESIKTVWDWMQINRRKKNMTACHLAAKMGIATALIHLWEDGTNQPDSQQLKVLALHFGVNG
jgi:ribosome-binding protein aMBF1 (putative translation factor)